MIERVGDLTTPPVVGTLYIVPCLIWTGRRGRVEIPTLGPVHHDPSFAPSLGDHYHYDPRFLRLDLVRVTIAELPPEQVALVIAHRVQPGDLVEDRALLCLRAMPPWPTPREAAPWVGDLTEAHRACKVGRDGRCPHAGTDGRSFPRVDGVWTCIHGLKWRDDDGSIV